MLQETASYGLFPAPAHIPKEVPIHSPFAIMPEYLVLPREFRGLSPLARVLGWARAACPRPRQALVGPISLLVLWICKCIHVLASPKPSRSCSFGLAQLINSACCDTLLSSIGHLGAVRKPLRRSQDCIS